MPSTFIYPSRNTSVCGHTDPAPTKIDGAEGISSLAARSCFLLVQVVLSLYCPGQQAVLVLHNVVPHLSICESPIPLPIRTQTISGPRSAPCTRQH